MEGLVSIDAEALLVKLNEGEQLSEQDALELVRLLESIWVPDGGRAVSMDDLYAYIAVLKRARLLQYRHVLERFLDARDSLTVALVLETLCLDWELTDEYLERVLSFGVGVSWDEDEDVKQTALKVLGEYLHKAWTGKRMQHGLSSVLRREQHVLALLLSTFEDEDSEPWCRQGAYFALSRAYGKSWENLPSECVALNLEAGGSDIDHDMIDMLKQIPLQSSSEDSGGGKSERSSSSDDGSTTGMR